ncbi:MAG: transporter substrate-binding domain-containing protein [Synergistaceae bacterium]|nr:transporter substrate-binding domain-containing protein [Synergistaceae bacterium]
MKKLVVFLLAVCLMAGSAYSADRNIIGHLSKLNMTPEEFMQFNDSNVAQGKIAVFTGGGDPSIQYKHVFYDSLLSMQMALNAGEVDAISLPEAVGEYFLNVNDGYKIVSIVRTLPSSLSFGFRANDDPALRNRFNEALLSMKADGTLAILRAKYIDEPGLDEPEPVKFDVYENIDTKIKVAVTGDLPPIDFVAADGKPAGFNTAVLAEIARRLKVNIELVNIDSGARAAALASGRADAVFWFQFQKGAEKQADIPEGITLSESYYGWNEVLNIGKK